MARKDYIVGAATSSRTSGHPRPVEALVEAELARKIAALIAKRGLTQADVLKIDQPTSDSRRRAEMARMLQKQLIVSGSRKESSRRRDQVVANSVPGSQPR